MWGFQADLTLVGDIESSLAVLLAVEALGGKVKPYPAKKALAMSRRWGSARFINAYDALADADAAMKGASAIPERTVIEILVARLAGVENRGLRARVAEALYTVGSMVLIAALAAWPSTALRLNGFWYQAPFPHLRSA